MTAEAITHGFLHSTILQFIIEHGYGPETDELAARMGYSEAEIVQAIHALAEYHGVVLHPGSSRIWVIHPFSLAPTNFVVRTDQRA